MSVLPENILNKMTPEARKSMGKAGMLATEAADKCAAGQERALQKQIANWLRLRGFPFVQSRTDKKTTVSKGVPDFICFVPMGVTVCIECKSSVGQLSPSQKSWQADMNKLGHSVYVVRSFKDFHELMTGYVN